MATTIQIKRSSTASAIPLAGDLAVGELAVNLEDKRLFTKQSDGTVIELSTNPTDLDAATLRIDGVEITASATELNSLDGLTATTAELNVLDGITATTAELNVLDGVTSTTAEINKLDGFTGTVADLNYAKDLRATGVTTTEFDKLDGLTATTAELNYTDGVTSNIQTQLNAKASSTTSPTITLSGDLSGSATLTNLGSATLTATVADDSHNHVISNVDGLQTALDGKATSAQGALADSAVQPNDDVSLGTITADGLVVDGEGRIEETGAAARFVVSRTDALNTAATASVDLLEGSAGGSFGSADNYGFSIDLDGSANTLNILSGNQTTVAKRLSVARDTGDVHLFEDTGTTAKFVWDASAESLRIGTNVSSGDLQLRNQGFIGFSNSADNGNDKYIYANGDNFEFGTAAQTRLTIDSSGNVGIGTASPSAKLHLNSNATTAIMFDSDASTQQYELGMGYGGVGTSSFYLYDNTANASRLVINSAGNVGIGTASPTNKLSVSGNAGLANGITSFNGSAFTRIYGDATHGGNVNWNTGGALRFAISNDDFSGYTERMRIDSAGNLRVGVGNTFEPVMQFTNSGRVEGNPGFTFSGDLDTGMFNPSTQGTIAFSNNGSESMRIDSSGNLLVGTTSQATWDSTVGTSIRANAATTMTASGGNPLYLNRLSNDGDLITFHRGSTAKVGSIGTQSGALTFANAARGFKMDGSSFEPIYSAGTEANGVNDIGVSANRWRNLYLSGGVYLGGTGAANKLDDYEEGTWTPTVSGTSTTGTGAYTIQNGKYVIVGKMVYVSARLGWSSHTGSGNMILTGLPSTANNEYANLGVVYRDGLTVSSGHTVNVGVVPYTNYANILEISTDTDNASLCSLDTAVADIAVSGWYHIA